jgi:16S rRNA G966 N2-methylase RsmD
MQQTLFDMDAKTITDIINPNTYKGLYSFHKYWGKKPPESIIYFIEKYTQNSDIVLDPFLGSGFISGESLKRNRRFIGVDINPFSIEHTKFLLDLPSPKDYWQAVKEIKDNVKENIDYSYRMEDDKIASHYLWNGSELLQTWTKSSNMRNRIELKPTNHDIKLVNDFKNYHTKNIREALFFTNSRINSDKSMTIADLFSQRALRNIDLIVESLKPYPESLQRSLYLTLTSASGQMSSMVFAITNRGKTKNAVSEKIEVGSWVIGFWRPELHFEINVWNCFENKAKKLYKSLMEIHKEKYVIHSDLEQLLLSENGACIINNNCLDTIKNIPDGSIQLVCTDPPHSDRIPYLELSEMWNAILNKNVCFENEIVVSNAKERNKKKINYTKDMEAFIQEVSRILKRDGVFLLYFNARDKKSWKFIESLKSIGDLEFSGAFPMEYSANSVVQDNRKGGLKYDYILIMKHKHSHILSNHEFEKIPGWLTSFPEYSNLNIKEVQNESVF